MNWKWARTLLVGVVLTAAHVALGAGLYSLTYWLYFQAGVKWTPDPVVPQIQGIQELVGQLLAALITVPAVLLARHNIRQNLSVAIVWPLAYAVLPFVLPHVVAWLLAAFGLFVGGLVLLRNSAPQGGG